MNKTILVIDDNQNMRENTAEILELLKYRILTAVNGKQGIKMIRDEHPDMILCDMMMPGINGYEVLRTIKKDTSMSRIPFFFLTALLEPFEMEMGIKMGAMGYIEKPFDPDLLLETVKRCMDTAVPN